MNRTVTVLLAFMSFTAFADSPNSPQSAKGNYTVKKDDTMWDLANRYLKDPYRWKDISDSNAQVKNPHWIYPGDVIYVPGIGAVSSDGNTVVQANKSTDAAATPVDGNAKKTDSATVTSDTAKTKPASQTPVPTVEDALKTLVDKRFFRSNFLCRVALLWDIPDAKGLILPGNAEVLPNQEKNSPAPYDNIDVKGVGANSYKTGDTVDIWHSKHYLRFNGKIVSLVQRVGRAHVCRNDDSVITLTIDDAWDAISAKDRITPFTVFTDKHVDSFVNADISLTGTVVEHVESSELVYPYHTLIIDKGKNDDVRLGDIFTVHSVAKNGKASPDAEATAAVVNVGDNSSTVAIIAQTSPAVKPAKQSGANAFMPFKDNVASGITVAAKDKVVLFKRMVLH